ncbi:hypothetical protein [Gordonia sp. NPDC003376]
MVAVGSNASITVLRRKFGDAGLDVSDLGERLVTARLHGLAVGYSGHVARRGYIPAAPFRAPGAVVATVAAWLEPRHLDALDATEPNYHRMTVSHTSHPLHLSGHRMPVNHPYCVYASRHGVLGDSPTTRLDFGSQQRVLDWLGHRIVTGLPGGAAAACARLSDPVAASTLATEMHGGGLVQDAGFVSDAGFTVEYRR